MKGLIAPVLVMMMTGMVFCQQPQSNSFDSNSSDSGIKLLRRFLLVMNDDYIRGLKTQGYLQAPIAASEQATTDHIEFHGSEWNAQRSDLHPFNITQTASLDNDGRLEFMLSDALIEVMRKEGLRYIIRPQDRGKYREVVVRYDGHLLQPQNRRVLQPEQQPRQTQPTGQFTERNRFPNRDLNDPIIGPALPDDYFERRRQRMLAENAPTQGFDRRQEPLTQRRQNAFENDFNNRNRFADSNPPRRNNTLDMQPRSGDFRSLPPANANRELSRQSQNESREQWRARLEQEELAAENLKLKQLLQDERIENVQRERKLELELDRQHRSRLAAADGWGRHRDQDYQYPNGFNSRTAIDFPSGRFPNRYERDSSAPLVRDSQNQNNYTQMPTKVAASPRPSNKPPAFAIPGVDSTTNQQTAGTGTSTLTGDANLIQRQNRLLWFIMLCSVALNFYLAMLSRGFYVRYEELADEIRETFTSSL